MNEIIGAAVLTKSKNPIWNTAMVTPNAAPTDNKNPRPATRGTMMERKTRMSRIMANPTTMPR